MVDYSLKDSETVVEDIVIYSIKYNFKDHHLESTGPFHNSKIDDFGNLNYSIFYDSRILHYIKNSINYGFLLYNFFRLGNSIDYNEIFNSIFKKHAR